MRKILLVALTLIGLSGYGYAAVTPAAPSATPVTIVGTSPISGTVTAIQGTGTNLHTVVDSGTITAVTTITNPVAVTGTFYQATQPVSAATLPLPTGAATEAKQDTLIAKDFATQTTLEAVLAKIIAAPATEATLSTLNGKVTACNTGAVTLTTTATEPTVGQVSIPTTVNGTQVVAINASRRALQIQNIGTFSMYCKWSTGVSASNGFLMVAGATMTRDVVVPTSALFCIGSGGTTTAAYEEVQ